MEENSYNTNKLFIQGTNGKLITIDKRDIKPVADMKNHEHVYEKDEEDETDAYYAVSCIRCPQGRLIRK